jgi:hypothetical protein
LSEVNTTTVVPKALAQGLMRLSGDAKPTGKGPVGRGLGLGHRIDHGVAAVKQPTWTSEPVGRAACDGTAASEGVAAAAA